MKLSRKMRAILSVGCYLSFLAGVLWFGQIQSDGRMLSPERGNKATMATDAKGRIPSSKNHRRTLIPLF